MKDTMDPSLPEDGQDHRFGLHSWQNVTPDNLDPDMMFNDSNVLSIAMFCVLMVVGATGNITVLSLLMRRGAPRTRINTMLVHLAIADLLVIFLMMPLEIAWAWTVSWKGGEIMCRVMAFCRVFGLYLSSFILICISVDRYYAVLKPLQLSGGMRRGRIMIATSWIISIVCSAPQIFIFHVKAHPEVPDYKQCITYGFLKSTYQELAYSLFNMLAMYGAPLAAFFFCYISILVEIIRRSKDSLDYKMRRSSLGFLGRARSRTLKMTITIVLVFFICWTPYYILSIWFWLDFDSARHVDMRVRRGLFLFACTNSCMNPIVYGAYNVRARAQDSVHRAPTRKDLCSCGETIELPPFSQKNRQK
ncbi:adipokinetic hormone receptor isoform X2 [Arctopsyche grandis]|uniref:adipokinetic hormone receptor isoform X2 n=1 Tax=Arctopsyche grandis TaxID=121162 RepID=UPI00406D7C3F